MASEAHIVRMMEYKSTHPQEWQNPMMGGHALKSLMGREVGPFAYQRALQGPPGAMASYMESLDAVLTEAGNFMQSEYAAGFLRFSLERSYEFETHQPQAGEATATGLQAIRQFWLNNLPALLTIPQRAQEREEQGDHSFRMEMIVEELLQDPDEAVRRQTEQVFRHTLHTLMAESREKPYANTHRSLLPLITAVFSNEQSPLRRFRQETTDQIYALCDYPQTQGKGEELLRELINLGIDYRKRGYILEQFTHELQELGIANPQRQLDVWRHSLPHEPKTNKQEAKMLVENYLVLRKLQHLNPDCIPILCNEFNIASFFRFKGFENRLVAQYTNYLEAKAGTLPHLPALFFLAESDRPYKEVYEQGRSVNYNAFGSSTSYNRQLSTCTNILQTYAHQAVTPFYYEVSNATDILTALQTVPQAIGTCIGGGFIAHGEEESMQLGRTQNDTVTLSQLESTLYQQALQQGFASHSLLLLNACSSYLLAQAISRSNVVVAGFLLVRGGIQEDEFILDEEQDTLQLRQIPNAMPEIGIYYNGEQQHAIGRTKQIQ